MRFNTLTEWLSWLESCHPSEIELGLERIGKVASLLGIDLSLSTVITVAGTNGKGSCVAAINALLLAEGCTVGCYTSPHLFSYNERVVINNRQVTDQQLIEAFERIDQTRQNIALTYFEFGTLAALLCFQQANLDYVILEVGLGGRLDAVNLVDADIAVITSIDIDHVDWLGNDRESIGREKAGVFRPGKSAICADINPPKSVTTVAKSVGADLISVGKDFSLSATDSVYQWSGKSITNEMLTVDGINFDFLPEASVAAALQVIALLGINQPKVSTLTELTIPGRFQRMNLGEVPVILDVAHNPAAAQLLATRLQQQICIGKRVAIFAVMADKDAESMMSVLKDIIDEWWFVELHNVPRAMPVQSLLQLSERLNLTTRPVQQCGNTENTLLAARSELTSNDELLVVGSFFTVAEAMQYLREESQSE